MSSVLFCLLGELASEFSSLDFLSGPSTPALNAAVQLIFPSFSFVTSANTQMKVVKWLLCVLSLCLIPHFTEDGEDYLDISATFLHSLADTRVHSAQGGETLQCATPRRDFPPLHFMSCDQHVEEKNSERNARKGTPRIHFLSFYFLFLIYIFFHTASVKILIWQESCEKYHTEQETGPQPTRSRIIAERKLSWHPDRNFVCNVSRHLISTIQHPDVQKRT